MKVIVINGSPRTDGFTAFLLHSLEKELILLGNDVEFADLVKLDMKHCRGCCTCYETGHCIMNDGAERLSRMIEAADGLVLGSPTYASNVSGLMKDLIDRGHFVIEQLLSGKYCITVATGENYGNNGTGKILDDLVTYSGGMLSDHIAMKAPFNDFEAVKKKVVRNSRRAALRLTQKRRSLLRNLYHQIIFNIGIRPFVLRKGMHYKGVIKRWSALGIIKE